VNAAQWDRLKAAGKVGTVEETPRAHAEGGAPRCAAEVERELPRERESPRCGSSRPRGATVKRANEERRLAIVLQGIAPALVAPLWRVRRLRDLRVDVRGEIADVLGSEAASRGLGEDETPNAYGVELGELFDALAL